MQMDIKIIKRLIHYFHDGTILDVAHAEDQAIFSLESSEITDSRLLKKYSLSKCNTIRGKLHVTGICEILLNQKRFTGTLHNLRDVGNIFDLCFERRKVIIFVDWYNHPPKQSEETDMFKYEITAKKIAWEHLPNLIDPFDH
ncbi:MAG: hypothetical protein A3F09_04385 [Chlamydiae bacterium RIFCSPHIGHO2_12_FULL_49_11]|nr:MAG: hypothetical protein A3F09_04385 [Chlamydiae bacterium RIFCSPHIGHO2_12_FULL_49_11]